MSFGGWGLGLVDLYKMVVSNLLLSSTVGVFFPVVLRRLSCCLSLSGSERLIGAKAGLVMTCLLRLSLVSCFSFLSVHRHHATIFGVCAIYAR